MTARVNERNQKMKQGSRESKNNMGLYGAGTVSQESIAKDMSWQATWNIHPTSEQLGVGRGMN